MAHIGLLCPTATGHLNSLLPLGRELQRRGHQVTVFQVADAQAAIEAAGLSFYPVGKTRFPLGRMSAMTYELGTLKGLKAVQFSVSWIKETTELFLTEMPDAIRACGVDFLIIDQVLMEGSTIAEVVNLPFITFCSVLPLHRESTIPPFIMGWHYSTHWFAQWRNQFGYTLLNQLTSPIIRLIQNYRSQRHLPPLRSSSQLNSPLLQLSHQPAEFEYPRTTLPPWFHFVGPLQEPSSRGSVDFPYEQLTGQPLIYASMGTLQNRQDWIFAPIAEACADLPVQLVLSLGQPKLQTIPTFAGNPIVVPYAPQIELLKRAALTVTHGGLNTTLESLTHGVPMVAIPVTNDQPGVAARIVWSGAGEQVPLASLQVPRLRATIQQVLTQPSYRENAQRLQSAIQRSGRVRLAANLVEQAIATQQPVLSESWAEEPVLCLS